MQLGVLLLLLSLIEVPSCQPKSYVKVQNSDHNTARLTNENPRLNRNEIKEEKKGGGRRRRESNGELVRRQGKQEKTKRNIRGEKYGKRKQKKRDTASRKHGEIIGLFDVCKENITLDYEASAFTYTRCNARRRKCKQKVKTPMGTEIGLSCLTFRLSKAGCKSEYLELNFKFGEQNARRKYCAKDGPKNIIVPSNRLQFNYFHRKGKKCSHGFICEVYTVGGVRRPFCNGCGIAPISVDHKIVNGRPASEREYPFQVSIKSKIKGNLYSCGGTLIKKSWVLTAAHCFFDRDDNMATTVEVGYGSISVSLHTSVTALKFIPHPDYNNKTFANDIAVVQLPEPLAYGKNDSIHPICLGLEEDIPFGGKGVAIGWGHTSFGGQGVTTLQEVVLDVISISDCDGKIRLPPDTSKVLCALTPYKDTCQGDSGGPLLTELNDGRWAQVAITSYGIECARPSYPSVYTKVSAYMDWISINTGGTECDSF